LTLTGTASVSNYRTALRSVTYHNISATPNVALTRTVSFVASDGLQDSDPVTRDVIVSATGAAVLSGVTGTGTYSENAALMPVAPSLVITDVSTNLLASATVSFTNWQAEDRVQFNNVFALQHSFSQDLSAHTASLMITGIDTLDHYQTLLRSVQYSDVSNNPVTSARVASIHVSDGTLTSNTVTRNINVAAVNDPPLLSDIETAALVYQANNPAYPAQRISATLLVGDADSTTLTTATIQITTGYQNASNDHDQLSFTNQSGITGSFDVAMGKMTLTGAASVSSYRSAIRSVTFSSSGSAASSITRILTITATDDFSPTNATSDGITRTVTVITTNIPPALTGIPATALAYVRGAAATVLAPGLFVSDADGINLSSATIQVTSNYQNGQDVLGFTPGFGVTGSFNASNGRLTLTGTTSLVNYQTLLRSVTYKTNTSAASTLARTITFIVNDGLNPSSAVTRTVTLS
jgi:hypothetical protein